jgi:hypothetical protein
MLLLPLDEACGADMQRARDLFDAGAYRQAYQLFETVHDRCFTNMNPGRRLWLLSEMAISAFRMGDRERCLQTMELAEDRWVQRHPRPGRALLYNVRLCAPADGGERDALARLTRALGPAAEARPGRQAPGTDAPPRPGMPPRLSGPGAPGRSASGPCPAWGPGPAVPIQGDPAGRCVGVRWPGASVKEACPAFFLLRRQAPPLRLQVPEGWVRDPGACCNLDRVSAAAGRGEVRVTAGGGLGRACGPGAGAPASAHYLATFRLLDARARLLLVEDLSIRYR